MFSLGSRVRQRAPSSIPVKGLDKEGFYKGRGGQFRIESFGLRVFVVVMQNLSGRGLRF